MLERVCRVARVPSPASSGFTEASLVIGVESTGKGEERESDEEEAVLEEKGKEENDGTAGTPSTDCVCPCPCPCPCGCGCVCICPCVSVSVCVSPISLTFVSYAALTDLSIISNRRPSMLRRCRALLALPPCHREGGREGEGERDSGRSGRKRRRRKVQR